MINIKVVAVLKLNKEDSASRFPVYYRLYQNGSCRFINSGFKCKLHEWDIKKSEMIKTVPNSLMMNICIRREIVRMERIILVNEMAGLNVTLLSIKNEAQNKVSPFDFYELCANMIKEFKLTPSYSEDTLKSFITNIKTIKDFRPILSVSKVNVQFLKDYKEFLRKKGNKDSSIHLRVGFVRKMLALAVLQNLIPANLYPKIDLDLNAASEPINWINMSQVKIIEKYLETEGIHANIVSSGWNFIVACYCGFRYGDMRKFNSNKAIINERIIIRTLKTGSDVSILVHSRLENALENMKSVAKIRNNTDVNKDLKIIRDKCGIDKHLSFHVARHTFAVECANIDIPIEIVQQLLGHADIKTTAIYYKIANKNIDRHMEKWDIELI